MIDNNIEFSQLQKYYNDNKHKNWSEWLKYDTLFGKQGKQGLTGLLDICNEVDDDRKIVFKMSQFINYVVHHEYTVMKSLNDISAYCPHFCKAIGTISAEVDSVYKKGTNPFRINSSHPIEKEVLLMEHVGNSTKFSNYIKSDKIPDEILYSTIKQVLLSITIAQKKKKFTHYDLHSYNIMMKRCNKDDVFLYVLDEDNQFAVPTYGHYPVIIDFGFSYIQDLDRGPAWPCMGHTDVGFMSDRFDWVADPKLFLVTVSDEIYCERKGKKPEKLRNIVKNIFNELKIDWRAGWDLEKKRATDYVTGMLEGYNANSALFDKYDFLCVDIIQTLIVLPFEKQNYDNIDKSYTAFLTEFIKIENEIGNSFYNLYILKGIVDIAREIRADYTNKNTREKAVRWFERCVYERINRVAKFCKPKNLHLEKLLCALLCFSKNIEGVLHDAIGIRMASKQKQYSKLPVQCIEQIYGAIDINLPSKYKYTDNTNVYVIDCITEKRDKFTLSEDMCDEINDESPISSGNILYKFYTKK